MNVKLKICLAAICTGLVAPSYAQHTATGIIPYSYRETVLDNGLTVILMPMPSNGLVSYWTIVRAGSRDEYEPGRTGFAHFFEHMMFRGTDRFPSEEYLRRLTAIGASGNAYTTDDLTAYHVSMASEDLAEVMLLESDRFQNLAYSEQDFITEAGAVYGEYRKNRTNPLFVLYEKMQETAFEKHTYGHTTMGFERDIAAMPTMFEYSKSFFSRYYRPDNVVLLIVGDLDPESAMALVREHYGDWEPGYVAPQIVAEPEQKEERHFEVSYDGQSLPLLWVAYKIDEFNPSNELRVAADLLAALAFGPTSAIYQKLVLDEQVVEFLEAESNQNRDPSTLDIYTRVKDADKIDYVLSEIDAQVAEYRDHAPDPERLGSLKSRLRYGFLMGLETPDGVANRLARHIAISGGLSGIEALYAAYEAIEPEDVMRAAERYFSQQRRTVGILRAAR